MQRRWCRLATPRRFQGTRLAPPPSFTALSRQVQPTTSLCLFVSVNAQTPHRFNSTGARECLSYASLTLPPKRSRSSVLVSSSRIAAPSLPPFSLVLQRPRPSRTFRAAPFLSFCSSLTLLSLSSPRALTFLSRPPRRPWPRASPIPKRVLATRTSGPTIQRPAKREETWSSEVNLFCRSLRSN